MQLELPYTLGFLAPVETKALGPNSDDKRVNVIVKYELHRCFNGSLNPDLLK